MAINRATRGAKMTKEELKKQLHSYRQLKAEHEQIGNELKKLEAFMTSPRGINMDGMPRGSGSGDPLFGVVSKHIALKERYQGLLEELASAQTSIEDIIEGLEPMERQLMRYRYLDGLTWEEVCVKIGYSWRQTHRTHAAVLGKLLADSEKMA